MHPPVAPLKTNRSLLKYILLSLITFGIYPLVFFSNISASINTIASRYDCKKTMHYCLLVFIVAPITLGIAPFVWFHNLSDRIGYEMTRRDLADPISARTFWLWYVLGSFIVVGPFLYLHKLAKAMNDLCADYNKNG